MSFTNNRLVRSVNGSYASKTYTISFKRNVNLSGKYLIKSFCFQNLIYNVDDDTNSLVFDHGGSKTATLTNGYYSIDTLAAEIQTQMNTADASSNFTVTGNTKTGKLTIVSASGNFTVTVSAAKQEAILGIPIGTTVAALTLTSTYPVKLVYPSIALSVQINTHGSMEDMNGNVPVTLYIPIISGFGFNEVFEMTDRNRYEIHFGSDTITELSIKLFDEHGNIVETNGGNFEMMLVKV